MLPQLRPDGNIVVEDGTVMEPDVYLQRECGFEYELCEHCGGDWPDHSIVPGPFGEPWMVCRFPVPRAIEDDDEAAQAWIAARTERALDPEINPWALFVR